MFEGQPGNEPRPEATRLTITVYTTDHCIFCKEAMRVVKRTARKCLPLVGFLNLVEHNLERTERNAHTHVNAVPTIEVGPMTFVGIPSSEDIEFLINQAVLSALTP